MASEAIGHVRCPWCASQKMRVSLDKGGKVTVTCSACHFQGFARGPLADMSIRQAMTPVQKAPAPVEPAPGQAIEVGDALTVAAERAAIKAAAQAEPVVKVEEKQPEAKPARKAGAFGW